MVEMITFASVWLCFGWVAFTAVRQALRAGVGQKGKLD